MKRLIALCAIPFVFLRELALAAIDTIKAILAPPDALKPAILAVPLDVKSPIGITLFANMVTLTPGTTSLEVSEDRRTLFVHVLDAKDPDATVASLKAKLEKPVLEALS